jgi:phospho-N-acetylmuramoyl-pentapeptide-transferase
VLYHFLLPLARQYRIVNVFNYISFRAVGAAVTALLLSFIVGPIILAALNRQSMHQVVREGTRTATPEGVTPTMGGLISEQR